MHFKPFLLLHPSPDTALASADLIVEAITENLPLKQKLFAEWDKVGGGPICVKSFYLLSQACPETTLFATNTSFLRVANCMKVFCLRPKTQKLMVK